MESWEMAARSSGCRFSVLTSLDYHRLMIDSISTVMAGAFRVTSVCCVSVKALPDDYHLRRRGQRHRCSFPSHGCVWNRYRHVGYRLIRWVQEGTYPEESYISISITSFAGGKGFGSLRMFKLSIDSSSILTGTEILVRFRWRQPLALQLALLGA